MELDTLINNIHFEEAGFCKYLVYRIQPLFLNICEIDCTKISAEK